MSDNSQQTGQHRDRFLIGVVVGTAVLVTLALVLVWQTPAVPQYLSEEEPEGVAVNYLLALEQDAFERAYRYLSPNLASRPADVEQFFLDVQNRWCFEERSRGVVLTVDTVDRVGEQAVVSVVQTVYRDRPTLLSDNRYDRKVAVSVERVNGRWYVRESDICWSYDWSIEDEQ